MEKRILLIMALGILQFINVWCMPAMAKEKAESSNHIRIIPDAGKIKYNKMIFGQFIEHFDNQVYGGLFDPDSKFSDSDGLRTDVIEALKEIKTPIVRWPGGCFVSTYHWMDGVGDNRTPVYDKRKILTGKSPDDYNDIGAENRVVPQDRTFAVKNSSVILPPHSLVFLTIE